MKTQHQRLVAWSLCGIAGLLILIGGVIIGTAIAGGHNGTSATPTAILAQVIPSVTFSSTSPGVSPVSTKQGMTPTVIPTHISVQQSGSTPSSMPTIHTAPTHCNGVCPNPWGYTLGGASQATQVTNPPANFCDYFPCIPYFWNGRGSVLECGDGMYSHSGDIQGACSGHNGYIAYLYNPLGPNPQPSPTPSPTPSLFPSPSPCPTPTPYPTITPTV